jgi:ABC-type glycerol-3-phosphate transport system substrate-binding protein
MGGKTIARFHGGRADALQRRCGWTRRAMLRTSALAAAALGAAGAGVAAAAAAMPSIANPVISLTFIPDWSNWDQAGRQLLAEAVAQFSRTPGRAGLRLTPLPMPGTSAVINSILGGTGPDVTNDCCRAWASYLGVSAFADVASRLRADNIPLTTWSPALVAGMAVGTQQLGLPVFDAPYVYAYRQDILDELGLEYPASDWTYHDAEKIWRACSGAVAGSGSKSVRRYGANVQWYPWWNGTPYWFVGFGGAEMDASQTRCLIAAPESLAAANWLYSMVWDNVITYPADAGGPASMANGTAVFSIRGGWQVLTDITHYGYNFKWDYLPMPILPKGRVTQDTFNFWGLNAYSHHPDAAWEVMKWVAAEDYWQEFVMRTTLQTPAKVSLWDKWEFYLTQAAPILRTKQIGWIRDAALGGYAYPEQFFRYEPLQADALMGTAMAAAWNRKATPQAAYREAVAQIDAVEAVGQRVAAGEAAAGAQVRVLWRQAEAANGTTAFPPPPILGPTGGPAPQSASRLVQVSIASGATTLTLIASGTGVNQSSDHCTFAGGPVTLARGDFVCRLVSVVQPKAGTVAPGVKIGLMARASLAESAASVAVAFSSKRGVHAWGRPVDGLALGDERPTALTAADGLIGAAVLQSAAPAVGANWLLKPVWFRLRRDIGTWVPYTSWDGTSWTVAGLPLVAEFAGAWLGLFAANHYGGVPLIGTFDHVGGFTPSRFVQLGPST